MLTQKFLNEFREANAKRANEAFGSLNTWTPGQWLASLLGEIGEAANKAKKMHRVSSGLITDPGATPAKMIEDYFEEICDCIVYLDLIEHHAKNDPIDIHNHFEREVHGHVEYLAHCGHLEYWLTINQHFEEYSRAVLKGNEELQEEEASDLLAMLLAPFVHLSGNAEISLREKFNKTSEKVGSEVML